MKKKKQRRQRDDLCMTLLNFILQSSCSLRSSRNVFKHGSSLVPLPGSHTPCTGDLKDCTCSELFHKLKRTAIRGKQAQSRLQPSCALEKGIWAWHEVLESLNEDASLLAWIIIAYEDLIKKQMLSAWVR